MTIKAIQTRYAGCHFRSRLEARWAVFFDHLDIKWEYEAQGFECTERLNCGKETFRYLPDFWLPDIAIHAEVKGSLTQSELSRLVHAAASLSSNDGGGCHDAGGHDVVVLGPIPRTADVVPLRLHMHKGDLLSSPWEIDEPGTSCPRSSGRYAEIGNDSGEGRWVSNSALVIKHFLQGWWQFGSSRKLQAAYNTARSARFEYGECGA
jgi:hypothetical protein